MPLEDCWHDATEFKLSSARTADYEAVLADHRRLVRELDVALSGEADAAKQASLCDLIAQAKQLRTVADQIDTTLCVHGHVDAGTDLHFRLQRVLGVDN